MALFIPGVPCCICGEPVGSEDQSRGFPHFVANRKDRLYPFSDGVVHDACLRAHPLRAVLEEALETYRRCSAPDRRRCAVCGERIGPDDDWFGTGLLTSIREHEVFQFNFLAMHRAHFAAWDRAQEFRVSMGSFLESDEWGGQRMVFDPLPRWESRVGDHGAERERRVLLRRTGAEGAGRKR